MVQSLAMFVTAAYVKRMTAIGGPVVTTAAFAKPMRVTGVFGTPVCATAGAVRRQLVATSGVYARVTTSIANHITSLRFCVCSSRNCSVCEFPGPTSNVRESSAVRN